MIPHTPASPLPVPVPVPVPEKKPGFVAGLKAFFGGVKWVLATTRVWGLAAVPVGMAILSTTVLGGLAIWKVPPLVHELLGEGGAAYGVLTWVVGALATVVAVVLAAVIGFGVAQTLSGPALESLVRRREEALGLPARPETTFVLDVWRSFVSASLGLLFGLPILAALFVVELLAPYAVVITVPLKLVITATVLAWDVCDYPLSVRGWSISQRIEWMWRHRGAVLGFSAALVLLSLLPCAFLLALPAGVAGATALIHDAETWERARGLPGR